MILTKVSGKSYRVCTDAENDAYDELSFKTDVSDVNFTDGTDVETNLSAIKGITSDMSCEDENIAISAKAVNDSLGGLSFGYDETEQKYGYYKKEADTEVFVPFSGGAFGTFTPTDKTITYTINLGFRPKALMIMNAKDSWCSAYYLNEETNEIHTQAGGYGDEYNQLETVVTITDNGFTFCLSQHIQPTNQLNKTHYYVAI